MPLASGSKVDVTVELTLRLVEEGHKVLVFFMYLGVMDLVQRRLEVALGK